MRILIAGVLGGIAMFLWASIAHMATPLASIGLQPIPGGDATVTGLHQTLGDRAGLYFFPFAGTGPRAMADQEAKLKVEPSGLLAYRPPGAGGVTPSLLGVEFALEVIESLLAAAVLAMAAGFGARFGMAVAIGLVAAMATNFSYWNWYGFSLDYTLANAFTELMKFVVAGLVIAWVLGFRNRATGRRA
jgi:hypothetical protein